MNESKQTIQIKTEPNIGNRFVAGLVDYIIIYGVTFFLIFTFGEPNDEGGYSLNGLPGLIPIIFWLIMTVGLEIGFGATIGNSLVGLKAIPKNGINRKLTFGESFKRHLLDPIDMFFFGLIGIITIKNTDKNLYDHIIIFVSSNMNAGKSNFHNFPFYEDYDYIFYIDPEGIPMEDNGIREVDLDFRKEIDDIICALLDRWDHCIKNSHTLKGTTEERIQQILHITGS